MSNTETMSTANPNRQQRRTSTTTTPQHKDTSSNRRNSTSRTSNSRNSTSTSTSTMNRNQWNERTIMISRIPKHFDEMMVQQIIERVLLEKMTATSTPTNHEPDDTFVATEEMKKVPTLPLTPPSSSSLVELVTLVYPQEDSPASHPNETKGPRMTTHPDDRFSDRPYKKKKLLLLPNNDNDDAASGGNHPSNVGTKENSKRQHCGYGFVRLINVELAVLAIAQIQTCRVDMNPTTVTTTTTSTTGDDDDDEPIPSSTSDNVVATQQQQQQQQQQRKRKYRTMYIGPCCSNEQAPPPSSSSHTSNHPSAIPELLTPPLSSSSNGMLPCFLWTTHRCPYGNQCKFAHIGPGSCSRSSGSHAVNSPSNHKKSVVSIKKRKCFNYKKGKCKLDATTCPYSHDFAIVPAHPTGGGGAAVRVDADKDCIDWKTKGKCRKVVKGLLCPYKHDPKFIQKKVSMKV
jgi:hypothetical protein